MARVQIVCVLLLFLMQTCRHCAFRFAPTPSLTASVVRTSESCCLCAPLQDACWAQCSRLVDAPGAQLALARLACGHAYASVTVLRCVAIVPTACCVCAAVVAVAAAADAAAATVAVVSACPARRMFATLLAYACAHVTAPLSFCPIELLQVCVTLSDCLHSWCELSHTRQQDLLPMCRHVGQATSRSG